MNWQALITQQPALARIPTELRKLAESRALESGATLFHIGDKVQSVFSVISGEIRLIRRDTNGNEVVLQRSRAGFFAEASLDSVRYHCDAVATVAGRVLCIPARPFRAALDEDADFRDTWLRHLAREVRKLRAQCERLNLRRADERVVHYIESEGNDGSIVLNQSRKAWAAELGLTHEALYRALSQLQRNGRLFIHGQQLSLKRLLLLPQQAGLCAARERQPAGNCRPLAVEVGAHRAGAGGGGAVDDLSRCPLSKSQETE